MSKPKVKQFEWNGEITIEKSLVYKNEMLEALEKNDEVNLSIENVTDIDISGLQIIFATQQEAELRNKKFLIIGDIPSDLAKGLKLGGIVLDSFKTGKPFLEKVFTTWTGEEKSTDKEAADVREN